MEIHQAQLILFFFTCSTCFTEKWNISDLLPQTKRGYIVDTSRKMNIIKPEINDIGPHKLFSPFIFWLWKFSGWKSEIDNSKNWSRHERKLSMNFRKVKQRKEVYTINSKSSQTEQLKLVWGKWHHLKYESMIFRFYTVRQDSFSKSTEF